MPKIKSFKYTAYKLLLDIWYSYFTFMKTIYIYKYGFDIYGKSKITKILNSNEILKNKAKLIKLKNQNLKHIK